MAFSKVAIAIPEVTGDIIINVETEEAVLPYTNQIPISVDTDGSVFNAVGYKNNYRINSSGVPVEINAGELEGNWFCTGFVAVKPGDTIRFYNAYAEGESGAVNIVFYNSDKTKVNITNPYQMANHSSSFSIFKNYNYNIDEKRLYSFSVKDNSDWAYIRFTLCGDPEEAIITINEEVTL